MARTRAQYAQQGRLKARRFAEAEKRPTQTKGGLVHGNEGPPVLGKPMEVVPLAQGVGCEVLRTMYTTARFLKYLMKQDEFFLRNLEGHFGVSIEVGTPKTKIHIRGPRCDVRSCYEHVRELLIDWHQNKDGKQ